MLTLKKLTQTGDTIVEVMMAVVILSGILGGTFAISNKSQKTTQANHERYQAQLYANQQAEWIKQASADQRDSFIAKFTGDQTFCMNGTTVILNEASDVNCNNKDGRYKIVITASKDCKYIKSPCVKDTYDNYFITVSWDSLAGGTDTVGLAYGI